MSEVRANHYVLAVHDKRQSAQWFVDVLGFQIYNEPPGWIFVKRDNCMIMLGECADSIPAKDLGDHSYFGYLVVDNADLFYERAKERGAQILSPIETKPWNMREFGIRTPEGHRITIGHIVS